MKKSDWKKWHVNCRKKNIQGRIKDWRHMFEYQIQLVEKDDTYIPGLQILVDNPNFNLHLWYWGSWYHLFPTMTSCWWNQLDNLKKPRGNLVALYMYIKPLWVRIQVFQHPDSENHLGQIIIFRRPRFPWNKRSSLTKPPFWVRLGSL